MRHLGAEPAAAHFAESAHLQTLVRRALELLQLARIEIEEPQNQALCAHDQLAARAIFDLDAFDPRLDGDRPARGRVARSEDSRLVLVAQRKVQDEIEARPQAELLELKRQPLWGRHACLRFHPACRIASISTSAPRGSPATPTATRAG